MPKTDHKELKKRIKAMAPGAIPGLFLIHGEELLVKTALETLLGVLLPGEARKLNYEPVDGGETSIPDALERVNTYSLLAGPKVVAILDSHVFYSKQDTTAVIDQAKEACKRNETRKAALSFLKVMALLGLSFEDVTPELRADSLKLTVEQRKDDRWVEDIVGYCSAQGLKVPTGSNMADVLQQAVTRGFPERQYLVITTDIVDRRRNLYKAIVEKGLVIDCSVPKGDRKADRTAQGVVLNDQLSKILAECGKKLEPEARALLVEMAGFNLRSVTNSVKQLASFTGRRDTITAEDVRQVVRKTRHDPIYDFTNSITDRNRAAALFFLNSLLADNLHPLQLLAAMVNQVRKLIHIKGFTESGSGKVWDRDCHYVHFRDQVIPAIVDYDRGLSSEITRWKEALSQTAGKKGGKKKKPGKVAADLLIARNPKNPYPVYQMFKKAERFSKSELLAGLELLGEADVRLKSTSMDPKLVLEEVVLAICP
jgi:DNA polymerase-3 subunit delta